MVRDIGEAHASGDIAVIFDEIRRLYGVPYVSAIHRIVAARPGFLEWAWDAVAPAFRSGQAQEAGWRCARDLQVAPLPEIPAEALAVWGIDADERQRIAAVCASFVTVAPANMIFVGLLANLLTERPQTATTASPASWQPPSPITIALPAMVDIEHTPPALRAVARRFATDMQDTPFVPGLYRMLANWPHLLAHLAVTLQPRLHATETQAAFATLRDRIDAAIPAVLSQLPPPSGRAPMPPAEDRAWFFEISDTYRKTSPEMIVAGRLVKDALAL